MVRTIILAAGASSRMGRPKSTLLLDGRGDTFLRRIIRSALHAGLPEILIVSGAHLQAARAAWPSRDRRVRIHPNADWQEGQLSSMQVGLRAPSLVPIEAAVVMLVDVPLVTADTIRCLLHAWRKTRAPIVRPARGAEHGHPVIFDRAIFAELLAADHSIGAKPVVRAHAGRILNVPIADAGAFHDIDTPQEYERIAP